MGKMVTPKIANQPIILLASNHMILKDLGLKPDSPSSSPHSFVRIFPATCVLLLAYVFVLGLPKINMPFNFTTLLAGLFFQLAEYLLDDPAADHEFIFW